MPRSPRIEPLESRRLLSASIPSHAVLDLPTTPTIPAIATRGYGVTLNLTAGRSFNGYLGTLSGTRLNSPAGITAAINWGDGSADTQGLVSIGKTGNVNVGAPHRYSAGGKYKVTITVLEGPIPNPGGLTPDYLVLLGTISSTAVVSDSSGGVTLHELAGEQFTASVGSFDFPAPGTGLAASINWGDGKSSSAALVPAGVIGIDVVAYHVVGTHDYAKAGSYAITAVVTRNAGPVGSVPPVQLIAIIHSVAEISLPIKGLIG